MALAGDSRKDVTMGETLARPAEASGVARGVMSGVPDPLPFPPGAGWQEAGFPPRPSSLTPWTAAASGLLPLGRH